MATFQSDSIGGGMGGGFGGIFGGNNNGGLIEGLLFGTLLSGRNGGGGLFGGNNNSGSGDLDAAGIAAKVVELQNSSNIKEQVANLGTETANMFATQNLANLAIANNTNANIASAAMASAIAAKDAEINTLKVANLLQTNIETLSTKNDAQYAATLTAISVDGSLTRALINQNEMNNLRDALIAERRRADNREVEINISNTNTNTQNQLQAQAQVQAQRDFDNTRRMDYLFNQVAQATNSIINVGNAGAVTTGAQTASPVNVK